MNLSFLKNVRIGLLNLFYPELCQNCQRHLNNDEKVLCLHCILKLPRTNFHLLAENKASSIFIGRIPIENATTFVYFTKDGMIQHLLHQFKYKGKKRIGLLFGSLLATDLSDCAWIKDIDVIIPVPLHKKKQRSRGFNQAEIFAVGLSTALAVEVKADVLIRIKFSVSQTTKSRRQRLENVTGIFQTRNPHTLENKHILLVDDVLTTGATLESCALELLKIQGVKISVATIAFARD